MAHTTYNPLKILVVIASYGTGNDRYLSVVLDEYRSMDYLKDIVVLSNVPRELGNDVEVIVGMPSNDPRSLPFGHRKIFADRAEDYELFLYSEDDTLVTKHNIESLLRVSPALADDQILGFVRFEVDENNDRFHPDVHFVYHWDVNSVFSTAGYSFAYFTNEHSACYMLTRTQLRNAIQSGGFVVPPHRGAYDVLESAATDVYTQCGFRKLLCISHFEDFLVHHLPNKYIGRLGLDSVSLTSQIRVLLELGSAREAPSPLLSVHPGFKASQFGKNYYEPASNKLVSLIPTSARRVLSIGCGWGALEERLSQNGKEVVALPLDAAISACAKARGVSTVEGDLDTALPELLNKPFDCILILNLLHLLQDPSETLALISRSLSDQATVIAAVPNLLRIPVLWRMLRKHEAYRHLGDYRRSGVHFTSRGIVQKWMRRGGLKVNRFVANVPAWAEPVCRCTGGLTAHILSSEIVAVASRQ